MDDIEKLLKRIEKMTAPIREVERTINRVIPPYIKQLNQSVLPVIQQPGNVSSSVQGSWAYR